jgi:hypothetical protein
MERRRDRGKRCAATNAKVLKPLVENLQVSDGRRLPSWT